MFESAIINDGFGNTMYISMLIHPPPPHFTPLPPSRLLVDRKLISHYICKRLTPDKYSLFGPFGYGKLSANGKLSAKLLYLVCDSKFFFFLIFGVLGKTDST